MLKSHAFSTAGGLRLVFSYVIHPGVLYTAAAAGLVLGAAWVWNQKREAVIPAERWALTPESIEINDALPWYSQREARRMADRICALGYSLADAELLPQAVDVLQSQPFVACIESATKDYRGLRIRLQYRIPVAVIGDAGTRWRLIDRFGVVVVPSEASGTELPPVLRIMFPDLSPHVGKDWDVWPDLRVVEAARICEELGEHYRDWGVNRLISYWRHPNVRSADAPWELWTPRGHRVIWRDTLVEDRIDARIKIAAINDWIAANGSLEAIPDRHVLDVRQGVAQLIPQLRSAYRVDSWR